jgi:hypothetical protein
MKARLLLLLITGVSFVAIGTDPQVGLGIPSACRPEGRIDGYIPSVQLRPCRGEIRSGATIHRGDRVTATGQVTFSTQHVETCTLHAGSAIVYPKKGVVLRLMRGHIYCRQKPGKQRWQFRGRNVSVTTKGTIFGITIAPNAVVIKVATGSVRVSARRVTRVVRANFQVTVPNGRRPGKIRRATLTATDQEAFRSLRFDVTTTHTSDLAHVFRRRGPRSGAVIAENAVILAEVSTRLRQLTGVRLVQLTRDEFVKDPDSAADAIRAVYARVAVIAGDFDTMEGVFRVLRENKTVRDRVGRDLLAVYVPVRSVDFDDLSPQAVVTTQYAPRGLSFGRAANFGVPSPGLFDCGPPTVRGTAGAPSAPNSGAVPFCNQTPNGQYMGTFGQFSRPVLAVSAWILVPTTCDGPCFFTVHLAGYDTNGTPVAQRSVNVGPAVWGRIRIDAAAGSAASIRFLSIHRERVSERVLLLDNLTFEARP